MKNCIRTFFFVSDQLFSHCLHYPNKLLVTLPYWKIKEAHHKNRTLNAHPILTYCNKFFFPFSNNYKKTLLPFILNQNFFFIPLIKNSKTNQTFKLHISHRQIYHHQAPTVVADNQITISQNHDNRFLTRNKLVHYNQKIKYK